MAAPALLVGLSNWTGRHPVTAPIGLAFASGLVGGPFLIGSTFVGWIIGRAGVGRASTVGAILAVTLGLAVLLVGMIQSSLKRCPSCVDAYIVAPFVLPLLALPFAIGVWAGRRSRRRQHQTAG